MDLIADAKRPIVAADMARLSGSNWMRPDLVRRLRQFYFIVAECGVTSVECVRLFVWIFILVVDVLFFTLY